MIRETEFVLQAINDNWPGGQPADVVRVNEDRPEVLDGPRAGERARSLDLSNYAVIRASTGDRTREPSGLEFRYAIETDVDVTVEAVHERDHGTVGSTAEFLQLVRGIRAALNRVRQYPEVQYEEHPQPVSYHTLQVADESAALSEPQESNYYRADLTVRLLGKEPTPQET